MTRALDSNKGRPSNRNDPGRALAALRSLDPGSDRETWVRIAMSAKSAGVTEDDFVTWSKPASNYSGEKDCRAVWRSIKIGNGIGEGSLYKTAIEAGWRDEPAKVRELPRKPRESAQDVWDRCLPASASHPYITAKSGIPDGLRIYPDEAAPLTIAGMNCAGALVIPVCSLDGALTSLQFVPPKGKKLNLTGHEMRGVFIVGELQSDGRAYVVEGIGAAWACWTASGAAAVCCFGSGRMQAVAEQLRTRHPSLRIVLVADRGKETEADKIATSVDARTVKLPADMPENSDASDYAHEHGLEDLEYLLSAAKAAPQRFNIMSASALAALPSPPWLVKGVLPRRGVGAIYGPPSSGKTFLTLDLCAAVSGGCDWFNLRTTQVPVLYLGLEGEDGLSKRVRAYQKAKGDCQARFVTAPLDVRIASDRRELVKAAIAADCIDGLLIVDTLNRAAPGFDENAAADMGEVIAALKDLESQTGGMVIVVHHTGKDSAKGLRGHSSLLAALDVAIEVKRGDSLRSWEIAKAKDAGDGDTFPFKLSIVELGTDTDGEPVTSCIVDSTIPQGALKPKAPKQPQGANQVLALREIRRLIKSEGVERNCGFLYTAAVPLSRALEEVAKGLADVEPKRKPERAAAAVNGLAAKRIIGSRDEIVWLEPGS